MRSNIQLSFRYLESDYVRALRTHYAARLHLRTDAVVIVVLATAGAYLWQSPANHWMGVGCVGAAVAFGLLLVSAFWVIPPLAFRREPKFRDDYTLTFSEEGIHFRTANIDSRLQWGLYGRALVDDRSYLLYYGERQFTLIPKRVFGSLEQQAAFEELLTRQVSKIAWRGVAARS